MSYNKPFNYVDGNVLAWNEQNSNDSSAKIYINQDILQADYNSDVFNTSDFQRGELNPITNQHQFTTGEVFGRFNDSAITRDRSYFTAHTKTNDATQTSATSKQYQAVYECGDTVVMEHDGSVFFTFGAQFVSLSNDVNTKGKWDSRVYLMISTPSTPVPTIIQGTRCYSYEETSAVGFAGTTDPGSVNYSGTPLAKEDYNQNRRWMQFQWMVKNLPAGQYRFFVAINPKVEMGYSSARQYTMEVFYDEKYSQG